MGSATRPETGRLGFRPRRWWAVSLVLTERDRELLEKLARAGPCLLKEVLSVYGQGYGYKRIRRLAREEFVKVYRSVRTRTVAVTPRGLATLADGKTRFMRAFDREKPRAREQVVLEYIATFGAVTAVRLGELLGTAKYHYAVLKRMCRRGLLQRQGKYYRLTREGQRRVGSKAPRLWLGQQCKKADVVAAVVNRLPGWRFVPKTKVKERINLNRTSFLSGVLTGCGCSYALYVLSGKKLYVAVGRLREEMKMLAAVSQLDRVLVVCRNPRVRSLLLTPPERQEWRTLWRGMKEVIVMQHPFGASLLGKRYSPAFASLLEQRFPGACPSTKVFADWDWSGNLVCVLVFEDVLKRALLGDYLRYAALMERRTVTVVCRESQLQDLRSDFPSASFCVLSQDLSVIVEEVDPAGVSLWSP